jgi:predicted NUDIX family NTP pyrophosphohydrolase/uncharacterized protein (DUF952 family)
MAGRESAGVLLYRRVDGELEVFLVHPGGPYFVRKDAGAWTLPKGEPDGDEALEATARREFAEETGQSLEACSVASLRSLGDVRQKGGKVVHAFAGEGDWPAGVALRSGTFEMEWPPKSGETQAFPEIDRGGFFDLAAAREKINPAQAAFLDRLAEVVDPAATIYKIVRPDEWDGARYTPSAADLRDGFVHLSAGDQVEGTLAKHFAGEKALRVLAIDPRRLPAGALRWEPSRGGQRFPHLYGALTAAAVVGERAAGEGKK